MPLLEILGRTFQQNFQAMVFVDTKFKFKKCNMTGDEHLFDCKSMQNISLPASGNVRNLLPPVNVS